MSALRYERGEREVPLSDVQHYERATGGAVRMVDLLAVRKTHVASSAKGNMRTRTDTRKRNKRTAGDLR